MVSLSVATREWWHSHVTNTRAIIRYNRSDWGIRVGSESKRGGPSWQLCVFVDVSSESCSVLSLVASLSSVGVYREGAVPLGLHFFCFRCCVVVFVIWYD